MRIYLIFMLGFMKIIKAWGPHTIKKGLDVIASTWFSNISAIWETKLKAFIVNERTYKKSHWKYFYITSFFFDTLNFRTVTNKVHRVNKVHHAHLKILIINHLDGTKIADLEFWKRIILKKLDKITDFRCFMQRSLTSFYNYYRE